ncbi:MAG TPA: 4'-phosphopantetheinyl transferase superfamily protein [Candidatus Limnocylindrales bacterium]|nr:4'-phosphopantetheinyl transferase superfamily protein [Candidatus Limnocylindrales bacterium]
MDVYWLEQTQADMPSSEDWLSDKETHILRGLRFPKRRADWLLGRWTAKNALAISLDLSTEPQTLKQIEVRPAISGAPEAFLRNQPAGATISLSHRAGIGACAVVPSRVLLGCDLEKIEPRSDAFSSDYFTAEEQGLIANTDNRDQLVALLWSAKESALKALCEGLRRDTRSVTISVPGLPLIRTAHPQCPGQEQFASDLPQSEATNWNALQVHIANDQSFTGWWMESGGFVRTLITDPPPKPPVLLKRECYLAR